MKEFNLEEAKVGKPVCTRSGLPVRIICFDKKSENSGSRIVALIETDKTEELFTYDNDGVFTTKTIESPLDLMMVSEKKEGWINLYSGDDGEVYSACAVFPTKYEARIHEPQGYITTIKAEWEE